MRTFIIFLFVLLTHFLSAQTSPVPGIGAHWTTARFGMFGLESTMAQGYQATNDSVINGHDFIKIGEGFFRDSLDIWYCIKEGQTEEHLFFDFNLVEGDTMYFHNPFLPDEFSKEFHADYAIVSEVDSIALLNGEWRKRIHLTTHSSTSYDGYDIWVAGIGSLTDMFWLGYLSGILDEGFSELVCFENENSELLYEDPVPDVMGIASQEVIYESCDWHVGIETHQLESILIYPNPVQGVINIEANQGLEGTSYRILNVYGQNNSMAVKLPLLDSQIDVARLSPGLYFLEISTKQNKIHQRFVKE